MKEKTMKDQKSLYRSISNKPEADFYIRSVQSRDFSQVIYVISALLKHQNRHKGTHRNSEGYNSVYVRLHGASAQTVGRWLWISYQVTC